MQDAVADEDVCPDLTDAGQLAVVPIHDRIPYDRFVLPHFCRSCQLDIDDLHAVLCGLYLSRVLSVGQSDSGKKLLFCCKGVFYIK